MICSCKICGKEFEATHVTALCPEHRYKTCPICGEKFLLQAPYNKITCSRKCSGIYRKQMGISILTAQKSKATKIAKYGSASPAKIPSKFKPRVCKFCGKEFIPTKVGQMYCDEPHYGNCPVCGKPVQIKEYYKKEVPCCSPECTNIKRAKTCEEKYGNA